MKISVIIPIYKPQSYLWECLDSIALQTFPKECFEVILVLNGCTEPYKSAIEKYIAEKMQGMNVNFIHTEVGGVSNARNVALDAAVGEYITFLDDDDYISPSYLAKLYNHATPNIVSLCYPLAFHDESCETYPYRITKQYESFMHKTVVPFYKACKFFDGPVYKLIHRDIIGCRRFNPKFSNGEDSLFMFLISDRLKNVCFTDKSAIYYRRIRQGSATTINRSRIKVIKNLLCLMKEYSCIYFKHIFRYSLPFYITRILGALHSMIV